MKGIGKAESGEVMLEGMIVIICKCIYHTFPENCG